MCRRLLCICLQNVIWVLHFLRLSSSSYANWKFPKISICILFLSIRSKTSPLLRYYSQHPSVELHITSKSCVVQFSNILYVFKREKQSLFKKNIILYFRQPLVPFQCDVSFPFPSKKSLVRTLSRGAANRYYSLTLKENLVHCFLAPTQSHRPKR